MFQKSWNWKRKNGLTSGCFKLWRKLKLYRLFPKLSKYLSFYPTRRTKVLKNSLFLGCFSALYPSRILGEGWNRGEFWVKKNPYKSFSIFHPNCQGLDEIWISKKFHMLAGFSVTSILLIKCQKSPSFRVPHITFLY